MTNASRPLPLPTRITQPFWEAAAQGQLLIQRCRTCSRRQFYPRAMCVGCLSEDLRWEESSGQGSIYTYTINHRAANEYMKALLPYAVGIIELDEKVRMMGRIIASDLSAIRIGARVKVSFEQASPEIALPCFDLL